MPRFHSETAAGVSGTVAARMLADLWAGADADRKAELYVLLTPYLYDAISDRKSVV